VVRRETAVGAVLAITLLAVGLVNPAFVSGASLATLLGDCAPTIIVACGVMLVIVAGEIDVSVGSLFGVLAALLGVLASPERAGWSAGASIGAVIGAGVMIGLANGVLIGLARMPSIIVTLGMMAVLRGVAELVLGGSDITDLPRPLREVGTGSLLGLHYAVWSAAVVAGGTWVLARRTRFGVRLYATGDNPEAATLAGVRTGPVKVAAFAIAGGLVAVAVVVSVPQLPKVEAGLGAGYELLAISAAVVGGVSVRGGVGTVAGVVLGAILLSVVRPALLFLKLGMDATFWERAIQGAFILGAVAIDHAVAARRPIGASVDAERGRWRAAATGHVAGLAILVFALLAVAGALDARFISISTQGELLGQAAELALLAVPMAMVLLAGGIDLSVGSIMALAAVVIGMAFERGVGAWTACGIGVGAATVCGVLNGVIVTRARIHPLIVTLATMALFRGVAEGLSGGKPVSGFPASLVGMGDKFFGPFSVLVVPAVLGMVLAWAALRYTVPGWTVRAVGFNETACRYAALRVDLLKVWLYSLSGACAGLAAVLLVVRRNTAKADAGMGIELDVITAVVLGGVSVSGGRGSIVGVALGVLLLHELRQFLGWRWQSDEVVPLVIGGVLIAATVAGRMGMLRSQRAELK